MLLAASVLFPVLLTIALGYVLERFRVMDARTLSTVSIYLLTPALVFYSLLTTRLSSHDIVQILVFLPLLTLALWAVTKLYLWLKREPSSEESTTMLGALFMNAGNYGIPLCTSAFGPRGVEHGVVWVILQNTLLFPLATYYAARDSRGSMDALRAVFRLPVIYAVAVALVLRSLSVELPDSVMEPVRSIGYAMIPMAQILLGVQLAKTAREAQFKEWGKIQGVAVLRLIVSPLLAIPLAALIGAEGLTRDVLILLSGTPTAVNITVLALEFNNRPHFVASVVFFTTVASFATLSVILTWLL